MARTEQELPRERGRPKKYGKKAFAAAVEDYFRRIRVTKSLLQARDVWQRDEQGRMVPVLDEYGHQLKELAEVKNDAGTVVLVEEYVVPPSITALCLFLGISAETWSRYAKTEGYRETVTRARGRVEAYLQERVLEKNASMGARFSLEHNFGWKHKSEISLDEKTQQAVAAGNLSASEKYDLLRKMGLQLPSDEDTEGKT